MMNYEKYATLYEPKYRKNADEIVDKEAILQRMSVRERFDIAPNPSDFYKFKNSFQKFIFQSKLCYQATDMPIGSAFIVEGETRANVSIVYLSLSEPLPYVDKSRFKELSITVIDNDIDIKLRSYAFRVLKLEPPYTDRCLNYISIGYRNKKHAQLNCTVELAIAHNVTISVGIVVPSDPDSILDRREQFYAQDIWLVGCLARYDRDNCDKTTILTDVESIVTATQVAYVPDLAFFYMQDDEPIFFHRIQTENR